MKKSLRIALTVAVLATFAPLSSFAANSGSNPRPQVVVLSPLSLAVSTILAVLGL
ncbi:MAG: hypothetical protein ABSF70_01705 [Terracidiphilus sp.]|jgi:hypothetical protein